MNKKQRNAVMNLSNMKLDKQIRISGTDHDRRRKLKDKDIKKIIKLYNKGYSFKELSYKYNVAVSTIKYHVDPSYKKYINTIRLKYGSSSESNFYDRVTYKRSLVASNRL